MHRASSSGHLARMLAAAGSEGLTLRALAAKTGLGVSTIRDLLVELPGVQEQAAANGAPAIFRMSSRAESSADNAMGRSRILPAAALRIAEFHEFLRQLLMRGEFRRLAEELRDPRADPAWIARAVPPKYRRQLRFECRRVVADAAMQSGNGALAAEWATKGLAEANGADQVEALLAIRASALRIHGEIHRAGADYAELVARARRNPQLRWIAAEAWTVQHVAGDRTTAAEMLNLAADAELNSAEALRILLRRAIGAASLAGGAQHVELGQGPAPDAPRWLAGWWYRARAVQAEFFEPAEVWNANAAQAWAANSGYGFQRALIMARVAASCHDLDPSAWQGDGGAAWRSFLRAVSAAHVARHGCACSGCAECGREGWGHRARHALGFGRGALPDLMST